MRAIWAGVQVVGHCCTYFWGAGGCFDVEGPRVFRSSPFGSLLVSWRSLTRARASLGSVFFSLPSARVHSVLTRRTSRSPGSSRRVRLPQQCLHKPFTTVFVCTSSALCLSPVQVPGPALLEMHAFCSSVTCVRSTATLQRNPLRAPRLHSSQAHAGVVPDRRAGHCTVGGQSCLALTRAAGLCVSQVPRYDACRVSKYGFWYIAYLGAWAFRKSLSRVVRDAHQGSLVQPAMASKLAKFSG